MANRKFLQVPITTREDERAIERVAKALRRSKADSARFLFREYEKKINEVKRASVSHPDAVIVQLTEAGEEVSR